MQTDNTNVTSDGVPAEFALLHLAEEMLGYCQLLLASYNRSLNETAEHRETMVHLKRIFDAGNVRERRHIDTLTHFPQLLKSLDAQYYELKDIAKALIRESQEERQRYESEVEKANSRLQDLKTELFSASAVFEQQSADIDRLQEETKIQRTQAEVAELRSSLRYLEKQNEQLEAEKAQLKWQIEGLRQKLESTENGKLSGSNLGTNQNRIAKNQEDSKSICELQKTLAMLQSDLENDRRRFESSLLKEEQEAAKLKKAAQELLQLVDENKQQG